MEGWPVLIRAMRLATLAAVLLALAAPLARAWPTAAQISAALAALDTTQNGALNADEWNRGSFALFRAADKNGNDFIEADELQASSIAQDTFLRADTDRDGRLSVGEFTALRRAIFTIADIDRDDNLSPYEFELLIIMEQVGWTDRNQNGRIELSELRDSLAKAFEQLDANHDSFVSAAEAGFMSATQFKKFNKQGGDRLSPDEFVNGYRALLLGESLP
jgi:Ca2+-binding EF-hand superfamily protein